MVSFKIKNPYCISLFLTFRCNASCVDCCNGCRPDFGRTMTKEQMKRYVDTCLEAYPNSITRLALTGGECFLLGDDLDEIVEYGSSKGLSVDVISNGYWGKSYKYALERIARLKGLGLKAITFSVGEDHQHLIPLKCCRNAIVASARVGYKVSVRIQDNKFSRNPTYKKLEKDTAFMRLVNNKRIELSFSDWQEYNNETIHRKGRAYRYRPYGESEPCKFIGNEIIISPYGDVMACCGIGLFRFPQIRLGNIEKEPIKEIYERTFQDALKMWIRCSGPKAVLQYVYDKSEITFHHWGTDCQCCMEIFSNPEIIPFLRDTYDDWIHDVHHYNYDEKGEDK